MLAYDTIRSALGAQPLFEAKSWQLSPEAWPLTRDQVTQIEQIGAACLEFHKALETLYLRSVAGKNLLRNKPLVAPWVAEYLDRGKPAGLVQHARDQRLRGVFPPVLRPDLLLTNDGFTLTELDSVPGGIGLTAFLNRLYDGGDGAIVGHGDQMVEDFYQSLAGLQPGTRNPLIALVVSEEAATYRPEMQLAGRRSATAGAARLLPASGGDFSTWRRAVLRCGGYAGEDRHRLPVLRAVRPRQHPHGLVFGRSLGERRGGHCPADAAFSGGETRAGPFPSSPAAGFLGRASGRTDVEVAAIS